MAPVFLPVRIFRQFVVGLLGDRLLLVFHFVAYYGTPFARLPAFYSGRPTVRAFDGCASTTSLPEQTDGHKTNTQTRHNLDAVAYECYSLRIV